MHTFKFPNITTAKLILFLLRQIFIVKIVAVCCESNDDVTICYAQVQELLLSNPDHLKVLASRNSIVQLRHRLSQSLSSHNMNLDLDSISNDNCSGTSSGTLCVSVCIYTCV